MTENCRKAFGIWVMTHLWNTECIPIKGMIQKNGEPVVMFFNDKNCEPYSVQYAGNGHYFKTEEEADEYIRNRGWKVE